MQDVILSRDNGTDISYDDLLSDSHVAFVENTPRPLRCVAVGGNPPPSVDILIGRRHYTDQFTQDITPRLTGEKGFRLLHTTTVLWTEDFMVTSLEDERKLKCIATVPGLMPQVASSRIQVNCK